MKRTMELINMPVEEVEELIREWYECHVPPIDMDVN